MTELQTQVLKASDPEFLARALIVLRAGGLVAFPTDTVYGLGTLASDGKAVESIYMAKERSIEKAIPILLAEAQDMEQVGSKVPSMARKLAARFWPGPLTLIIPKNSSLPEQVSATDTVGVRVPDHPVARALLHSAGPLAVTSANLSGHPSPSTADEVFAQLSGRIALIIDGGESPGGVASTVVDCTGARPVILRPGTLTLEELQAVL
jgi:L-threonylcarbamoyladenylate synthase